MTAHELKKDVPPVYLRETDTRKFIEILDLGLSNIRADILSLLDAHNLEKADEKWLDLMLIDVGWDLTFGLTVDQKRKAIKIFMDYYSLRGLDSTIIGFILDFLGLTVTIDRPVGDCAIIEIRWRLPFHRIMGPDGLLTFTLHAPSGITAGEEAAITEIVDMLRWGAEAWRLVKDL